MTMHFVDHITANTLVAGWSAAGREPGAEPLCGGYPATDVDLPVDDGATARLPEDRVPLGTSCLAWVPRASLRPDLYAAPAVCPEPRGLSGANRHRRSALRTLALVHELHADPERLERAVLLATLVGLRAQRPDLCAMTERAVHALCAVLGRSGPTDIWARLEQVAPLPARPPAELVTTEVTASDGVYLGYLLRKWHDRVFSRLLGVRVTPVRGGFTPVTLADFEAVAERLEVAPHVGAGASAWKEITRSELLRQVWSEPRMALAARFGVSDVAIAKRCRSWEIVAPPRGYWQQLHSGRDPRPLLVARGVVPPDFVGADLARRFDLEVPTTLAEDLERST